MTIENIGVNLSGTYVSIGQAASILNVNRLTIRHWLQKGKLRGQRIGLVTLILKNDVSAIDQQKKSKDF